MLLKAPFNSAALEHSKIYTTLDTSNYIFFQTKMASTSSSGGAGGGAGPGAYIPDGVNLTKAKVKKHKNSDWSWEDEMLMYDVSHRDTLKKRRRVEKEEMTEEMKKIKKDKQMETLYQREERKLFLGENCSFVSCCACVFVDTHYAEGLVDPKVG
jgi:hypothetical protein